MPLHGDEHTTRARTYDGVHKALNRARGRARGRKCAHPECDRPATGWALIGHPTHIGVNSHGKKVRFSIHLDDYSATCSRHNSQHDHGGNWTRCPRGHARAAWGVDTRGTCKGCVRERNHAQSRGTRWDS
ncbi:hypothetical protein QF046_002448 [Microbacterium sp. W4I4]|nr:hypothetical protein [Microbacterium sp. W4I4]